MLTGRSGSVLVLGLLSSAVFLFGSTFVNPASANGFGESRPWQFETSSDKANKAFVLDLKEKKRGGFYDAFGPPNITNITGGTTVHGDLVNCSVSPQAVGNLHNASQAAQTSSPTFTSSVGANTTGNAADNANGKGGTLNNGQENTGSTLDANVTGTTVSNGATDASGGTTSQVLNNTQTNSGNQHASATNSQGCVFYKK